MSRASVDRASSRRHLDKTGEPRPGRQSLGQVSTPRTDHRGGPERRPLGQILNAVHNSERVLAARLEQEIAQMVQVNGITKLYLVGHSYGALLLRRAILINMGLTATSPWQNIVARVLLLGGANRGFLPYNAKWKIGALIAWPFQLLPSPWAVGQLALKGLRGSNWVTNLRMAWLKERDKVPFTVQIRGMKDSIVGPHDSLDVSRSPKSKELVIDDVGHKDLALLNKENLEIVKPKLAKKIIEALQATVAAEDPLQGDVPHHVVFLVHGIRDFAEWHEDLAETIRQVARQLAPPERTVDVEPISYGYFSVLQFLIPMSRRRCARTFLDRYVQCYARNPGAIFSAVAHSNGTFALTWAMKKNRFVRLKHIFIAGSVLYRKFNWQNLHVEGMKVLNECAALDWPVGAICWFLRMIYLRRLGTSGVYGFVGPFVHPDGFVRNNVRGGGHSDALNARRHEEIARFVLTGAEMSTSAGLRGKRFRNWVGLWAFRFVVVFIFAAFVYLYSIVAAAALATWPTVALSAGVTVLLLIVLLII